MYTVAYIAPLATKNFEKVRRYVEQGLVLSKMCDEDNKKIFLSLASKKKGELFTIVASRYKISGLKKSDLVKCPLGAILYDIFSLYSKDKLDEQWHQEIREYYNSLNTEQILKAWKANLWFDSIYQEVITKRLLRFPNSLPVILEAAEGHDIEGGKTDILFNLFLKAIKDGENDTIGLVKDYYEKHFEDHGHLFEIIALYPEEELVTWYLKLLKKKRAKSYLTQKNMRQLLTTILGVAERHDIGGTFYEEGDSSGKVDTLLEIYRGEFGAPFVAKLLLENSNQEIDNSQEILEKFLSLYLEEIDEEDLVRFSSRLFQDEEDLSEIIEKDLRKLFERIKAQTDISRKKEPLVGFFYGIQTFGFKKRNIDRCLQENTMLPSEVEDQVFFLIEEEQQALICKRQYRNSLGRKMQKALREISEEEIQDNWWDSVFVIAGSEENSILLHWHLDTLGDERPFGSIFIKKFLRKVDGKIVEENDDIITGLGGYQDPCEFIESCVNLTKIIYKQESLDIRDFDFFHHVMYSTLPPDVPCFVLPGFFGLMEILRDRCENLHLPRSKVEELLSCFKEKYSSYNIYDD